MARQTSGAQRGNVGHAYPRIVAEEVGHDVATSIAAVAKNHVTDALAALEDYAAFRASFKQRLGRLGRLYSSPGFNRRELGNLLRGVAGSQNWQGAYAELVALDFLSQPSLRDAPCSLGRASLHPRLPAGRCLCGHYGATESEVDFHFDPSDFYCEVKSLRDSSSEVVQNVIRDALPSETQSRVLSGADYARDISPRELGQRRSAMLSNLKGSVGEGLEGNHVVAPEVTVRITERPRANISVGLYNPYRHASHFPELVLADARQFVTDRPFLLVFVILPWFNNLVGDIHVRGKTYCRAAARRVFCQYLDSKDTMKSIVPKFSGEMTIEAVLRFVSGVLFVEDTSILGERPEYAHTRTLLYLNPNAANPLEGMLLDTISNGLGKAVEVEDFKYDNY